MINALILINIAVVAYLLYVQHRLNKIENMFKEPSISLMAINKDIATEIIISAIEEALKIDRQELFSDRKITDYVDARKIFYHHAFDIYSSQSEIGRILGQDHNTVRNALSRYDEHYDVDPEFKYKANKVIRTINRKLNETK